MSVLRTVRRPLAAALGLAVQGPLLLGLMPVLPAAAQPSPVPEPARAGRWPLSPRPEVVDGFDPPASPWGAGHRGVDLAGSVGQPVHAARAGTVSFAGRIAGRGVVAVDHGGTRTTYEPVQAVVRVGDPVGVSEVIGTLALFGSHCFPRACLHWGLVDGETYLNPLILVGAGPVRLLPFLVGRPLPGAAAPAGPVPQLPRWRPLGAAQLFRG